MIDICDFAVGLSRQLYGLTMMSERPLHRMYEQWHPLGVVGIISAFNFPVAVWAWNAALAAVCGDAMIWKPSSKTPLTAIACMRIAAEDLQRMRRRPGHLLTRHRRQQATSAKTLIADRRIPLISATGSCRMGRRVGEVVGKRLGRTLLELGGNNAIIVTPAADLDLAMRGDPLRRGRHRRPALHQHAPPHCARDRRRIALSIADRGLQAGPHRQSAGSRHADGPADRSRGRCEDMQPLEQAREQGRRSSTAAKA